MAEKLVFQKNVKLLEPSRGQPNDPRGCLAYRPFLHWLGKRDKTVSFLDKIYFFLCHVLLDTIIELSLSCHFI